MNTALRHRRYRLTGRLAADFAVGIGLWIAAAVVLALVAELGIRLVTGDQAPLLSLVVVLLPIAFAATGWVYLVKMFPAAISAGVTRRETLVSYALFGLAVAVASALLVQVGGALQTLILGDAEALDFYGSAPLASLARPLLYFAAGAAAAALTLRTRLDRLKGLIAGLIFAVVVYREIPLRIIGNQLWETTGDDVIVAQWPAAPALLTPLDLSLAAVFAAIAWAALARAPMAPSRG